MKKKIALGIFTLFLSFNLWFFGLQEYKEYVLKAPDNLVEARKDFHKAMFFYWYYSNIIKITGLDFKSSILKPLKNQVDFYYNRGLTKLPKNDAERVIWFYLFEVRLYNQSFNGKYGVLTKNYGEDYTKYFLNKIYQNLEYLNKYEISDKNFYYNKILFTFYIHSIEMFIDESGYSKEGYNLEEDYLESITKDEELNKNFLNIYDWKKQFLDKYSKIFPQYYIKNFNIEKLGWTSLDRKNYLVDFFLNTFLHYYEMGKGEEYSCLKNKYLLDRQEESFQNLHNLSNLIKEESLKRKNQEKLREYHEGFSFYKNNVNYIPYLDLGIKCEYIKDSNNPPNIYKAIKTIRKQNNLEIFNNQPIIKEKIKRYSIRRPYKALAMVIDEKNTQSVVTVTNQTSQIKADEIALKVCNKEALKNSINKECSLYVPEYTYVKIIELNNKDTQSYTFN